MSWDTRLSIVMSFRQTLLEQFKLEPIVAVPQMLVHTVLSALTVGNSAGAAAPLSKGRIKKIKQQNNSTQNQS